MIDRDKLADQLVREIGPLLKEEPFKGGYNCCGCGTYSQILDHAVRIVRKTPDPGNPQPGDVWMVQRDQVPNEAPSVAEYQEDDDGTGHWYYFGVEWSDRADPERGHTRVTPIELIWREVKT